MEPMEIVWVHNMKLEKPHSEEHPNEAIKLESLKEVTPAQGFVQELLKVKEEPEDLCNILALKVESSEDLTIEDHTIKMGEEVLDTSSTLTQNVKPQYRSCSAVNSSSTASDWIGGEVDSSSLVTSLPLLVTKHNKLKCKQNGKLLGQLSDRPNRKNVCSSTDTLRNHVGVPVLNLLKCQECGKSFTKKYISTHLKIHYGEKPFKCGQCNRCFTDRSAYKRHINVHSTEKPYTCEQCGRCFNDKTNLKIHLRIHTGEKPHKCESCGNCFTHRSTLVKHLRIHSGERPHKCSYCGTCFAHRNALLKHVIVHSEYKPFKCEYCSESFSDSITFKIHLGIHRHEVSHTCSECGKGFSKRSSLITHLITHSDDKMHKCNQCGNYYTSRSSFILHYRKHSIEKT